MKKQNVVIVGFGFMGQMHAQAYAGISRARLAGVVDIDPASARRKLKRLGMKAPVFSDLALALRETKADIADICLPTDRHADAAVLALNAGRHVFCEKPVARSLPEAGRMRRTWKKSGAFVQVGQCIRFWPEYQAFEKFVRAGKAGRLLSLTMQRRAGRPGYSVGDWLNQPKRSMGAALDLHIHDTDWVLHLLGTPAGVASRGTKDASGWSHIFTEYLFPKVVVHAEGGWNYPASWGFQMAFQALFERGAIEFDSTASPTLRVTIGGHPPRPLPFVPAGGKSSRAIGNVSSLGGYANELAYFIDCVSRGRAPRIATLDQAIESLRVVLGEMKSAATGRVVSLRGGAR